MTITIPHQGSQYVDKDGRPTKPFFDLLRALVSQNNELTPAVVTALSEQVDELVAVDIHFLGTNGVTVVGSVADGFTIIGPGASAGAVPYFIPTESAFSVATNAQALFHLPIRIDGSLVVDGALVEV